MASAERSSSDAKIPLTRQGAEMSSALDYAAESIVDIWDEIQPLWVSHWEEIAMYKDVPLDPDKDGYVALQHSGKLKCFTLRLDGKLVGYFFAIVSAHLHYKSTLFAMEDIVYLKPELRGMGFGRSLLSFGEEELAKIGVKVIVHHAKVAHPQLSQVLATMGYEQMDGIWTKRI